MNNKNYFNSNDTKNFYIKLLKNKNQEFTVTISAISLKNQVISVHYGFVFENVFYYILPAYDYNFRKFSPVNILLTKLIENCFDNKIKILDFGEIY